MSKSLGNFKIRLILLFPLLFLTIPVYADYSSLQENDCALLQESNSQFKVTNSTTTCSSYTPIATTSPVSIQVFGKCTNGDIRWPRFDVFTYNGVRGSEVGGSKLYQAGNNYPLFSCDNANRNVDGTIKMPIGTNQPFFVAVSNASSSDPVIDLFEKGIGSFANALIHFDIKSAFQEPPKPDPVIIIPGILGSSDKNGEWVIDPIFHTYDDLIATLEANGYEKEKDLFTMPYDWRESNVLTALKLRNKINEVQAVCQCDKVDLVAHSMGGLVARQYIQSDKYENDVDQLIFLGAPHLGAPKSYLMWEGGTIGTEFNIADLLFNAFLRQQAIEASFLNVNSKEILFNYIHNPVSPILSLQELLPVYSYLKDFDTGTLRNYPTNYPKNSFLENLNTELSIKSLEQSGVNITNIFSDSQNDTIKSIRVTDDPSRLPLWKYGMPEALDKGSGDGTVPPASSLAINITNNTNINIVGEHKNLPTSAEDKVVKILTGKLPATTIATAPIKKFLSVFGLSPIDILITAPDGKRIGKDFATNQEVNEIAGAFYSGFNASNENIFIFNPLDGEYIVATQGTGDGSYTILADYIREEVSGEAISTVSNFTANTTIGREENLRLNFFSVAPENTTIVPVDDLPPVTIATALGVQGTNNWYTSNVSVTLLAQDNDGGTGVFKTEYSIDNGINWHTYSEPFVITEEEVTILLYRSQDFMGNMEESKLLEIKIDKTPPEARVYFDKENKTMKIEGVDNSSQPQVVQNDKTFIIQDEAGHTLKLIFNKLKQEGKEIKAELGLIQYDSQTVIQISENNLKIEWSVDKKTNRIKELEQKIGVKNKFEIIAKFNNQKQNTKVKIETGTERDKQKYEETLEGLRIIKLITLSGELRFEF